MSVATTPATLPKSGAVSKGYNFAYAWEKEDGGTTMPEKQSALEEAGAMDAVLVNTHQFYKWFAELESAMKSETEEKYRLYESTLEERVNTCDGILKQVDDTLNLFEELQSLHSSVAIKTKTLHDACDQLLVEKQRLIEFADALRSRYVENNPQYAEYAVYLVKFRQLQSRALGMIRSHVLSTLKAASAQVQAAIRGSGSGKNAVTEGVEASLIYVCFKAAAGELKPIFDEIESRSAKKEYAHILSECHSLFCEQRLYLIRGMVQQSISEFAKNEALPSLTRCTHLYDTLRPRLIYERNIDSLCELVNILKAEVLAEQLSRPEDSVAGLRPIFQRVLADVHERLAFCALTHIREEVTAVKVALSAGSQGQKLDSVLAKPLKTQAFASPDKVAELVQKVGTAIQEDLPKAMIKMRTNIVEAHIQPQSLVKSEYSADEIQSMGCSEVSEVRSIVVLE
ncbi:hypothetical protein ACQ4PT_015170 [Festuca glaucescens]